MNHIEKQGKVWLVGAGPGDIGLLTCKGYDVLTKAEVVVYDALVSDEIAALIPKNAKKINVGKRANNHLVPQEEINQILLDQAIKGLRVVRLKGGDPFVFGRGGEELELLVENHIPYEVVPGITSAVSVPAYAGIPVTHREYTSSVYIISGHARKGSTSRIQYDALVKLHATLVFLMGVGALEEICHSLIQAGMDASTPAAVLERGTSAKQRRVIATVSSLKQKADEAKIVTPAIIVVGDVCQLSETFAWVEQQPLAGLQVVVTRPKEKNSKLTTQLRDLGCHVIELPAISTVTTSDNETKLLFATSIDRMKQNDEWILFTSPKGVQSFFELLSLTGRDLRSILCKNIKFGVVGNATKKELRSYGIEADYMPDTFCGEALAKGLLTHLSKETHVTLYRAAIATEELTTVLAEHNVEYTEVPVYLTEYTMDQDMSLRICRGIEENSIDYITFTSASCVTAFVNSLNLPDYMNMKAICIGEQTAAMAREYKMQVEVAKEASITSMVECLLEKNKRYNTKYVY